MLQEEEEECNSFFFYLFFFLRRAPQRTRGADGIEPPMPPSEKVAVFSPFNSQTLTVHATFNFNLVNRSVHAAGSRVQFLH